MFKAHGSFETLEIQISKRSLKSLEKEKSGGWYTKQYLESKEGWTKSGTYLFSNKLTLACFLDHTQFHLGGI